MTDDIQKGFMQDHSDLSQLEIIEANNVRNLVGMLSSNEVKKKIIVIGTGGTLSMRRIDGIRSPDLDVDQILGYLPQNISDNFSLNGLSAFHLDSAQLDYRHVRDLAIAMCYIWINTPVEITGFLILHGTDTLTFSGSALSLMMGQGLPFSIVMTAAQKPIQNPTSDAIYNISNAIHALDSLHSSNMAEVISVMGDHGFLSSSAVKIDDICEDALISPMHQPVFKFNHKHTPLQPADWLRMRRSNVAFEPSIWHGRFSNTLVIQSYLGLSPEMVAQQIHSDQVHAVLLYSYGAGTIYDGIIDVVIEECRAKSCPLFVLSPVYTSFKIVYESAQNIIDRGAIALHMTLPAALAKIEIALRMHHHDQAAIAEFMQTNYVGEIPPND